jgi:dolichol-phosphate mannosyltransferase
LPDVIGSLTARRGVRQFVKFGIVGASGFLVNLVVFTLLQRIVPDHARPLQYNVIYSIAFFSGGVSNYYFNRIWTFRSTGHAVREGAQFLTVSAIALGVGLGVSALVSPWLGHGHKTWLVATLSGIVVNFFLNKYWTFKHVE